LCIPQPSCYTVPHHPAANNYKQSSPNSSQVTHAPDIPRPVVFFTPFHLLFSLELQTLRNFIALQIRTGIWKRQTLETPESSNKSLCNVFARFTSTARTHPPRPHPLSARHNRYQNTSLLPTTTFTTVSTPTPTHMIYCPRGSTASLTLQYLSRIHVLGARSQSGGTTRRTYFSHCAWIGQQNFFQVLAECYPLLTG